MAQGIKEQVRGAEVVEDVGTFFYYAQPPIAIDQNASLVRRSAFD